MTGFIDYNLIGILVSIDLGVRNLAGGKNMKMLKIKIFLLFFPFLSIYFYILK